MLESDSQIVQPENLSNFSQFNRVEISRANLLHNLAVFQNLCKEKTRVMPVLKSNGYGHGLAQLLTILEPHFAVNGAGRGGEIIPILEVAVNSLPEALFIHQRFPRLTVMIMGEIEPASYGELSGKPFITVQSRPGAVAAIQALAEPPEIHLKIDTGMNRLGLGLEGLADTLAGMNRSHITGAMTHFANIEDVTQLDFGRNQLERFEAARNIFADLGWQDLEFHAASSAAAMLLPESHFDLIRPGISLYGVWASNETKISAAGRFDTLPELKPVLEWKSKIVLTKWIEAGDVLGYGCTWRANRRTLVGVVPTGYYEGYNRSLGNNSYTLVNGNRAQVIGRVCMNMLMVDLTDITSPAVGDDCVLIGRAADDEISADYLAAQSGTINYETLTMINSTLPRIIV